MKIKSSYDYSVSLIRLIATIFIITCHIMQYLSIELAWWFNVGDTVQISYEGEIDETSGNTIAGAISAFKATISDGDVLIPE